MHLRIVGIYTIPDAYDVTYCFTSDAEREVTESEAIARFTHNERKRINHK